MNLSFRLHQIRTAGASAVVVKGLRKVLHKLSFRFTRYRAYTQTSYHVTQSSDVPRLVSLFHLGSPEQLSAHSDALLESAEHYLRHEFHIAGCGWMRNSHAADVPGLQGFVYKQEPFPYTIDETAEWVGFLVNPANAAEAQRLWKLIEQPYVPIDWQRDMRSGYTWSEGQWSKEIAIRAGQGIDPKVPWDFGRMHHLLHLSLARHLSTNLDFQHRCEREFRSQLLDFIALNPPGFGIQWTTPMDVAIRIANILVAVDVMKAQSVQFDSEFEVVLSRSVHEHAQFIVDNLEWADGQRANHYLANIAGVSVCAAYMQQCPLKTSIRELLAEALEREALYQFHEDGSNFEASTSYHRLSAELLAWALAFALKDGCIDTFSENLQKRLHSIYTFSTSMCYGTSLFPQIGDNDSGRFLPFFPFHSSSKNIDNAQNHADLLSILAALLGLKNPSDKHSFLYHSFASFITTPMTSGSLTSSAQGSSDDVREKFFVASPNIGLYRNSNASYDCFMRAGNIGQKGKGGHAHNDQLSITLAVLGAEIFCDAGTYLYTALPNERNRFRSTRMHNTLWLDGVEQNDWPTGSSEALFWLLGDRTQSKVLHHSQEQWHASHEGFSKEHRRDIEFATSSIHIYDCCKSDALKHVSFHIHPACVIRSIDKNHLHISRGKSAVILSCAEQPITLQDSAYSPEFGAIVTNSCAVISTHQHSLHTCIEIVDNT